jgi:GNAT superfamily N-acetyltransferase
MALSLRRLVPADAPAYRALMLKAYADDTSAFTSSAAERERMPLDWWAARVAEGEAAHEQVFGAFDGEQLVGAAGLSFETREKTGHKATLFGMYVLPSHRGRGLARALVQAVLAAARARAGVKLVQLTVTQGNATAEALYRSCGFEAWGAEPMAMFDGARFHTKVHMACEL